MNFRLSLATNPLINRVADPAELMKIVAQDIGIGHIQLTNELINPHWPKAIVHRLTQQAAAAAETHGVKVTSVMTGPFGRINHFGHPDAALRRHYVDWFKTLVDIGADLGAETAGSQYAILTWSDFDDLARRQQRLEQALACWAEVAEHAASKGLKYLFWEPMSVGRELGHTIAETARLQDWIDKAKLAVPLHMMVDIDHGDVSSTNPADTDPYAWAQTFAARSPIIHIKQSSLNKGGHWPFADQYNGDGRITPQKFLAALKVGGGSTNELCMEFTFREREPSDRNVIRMCRESVAFWQSFVNIGQPK